MLIAYLACLLSISSAGAADRAAALFHEAEQLARSKQNAAALAKAEQAANEVDRARAAGQDIGWHAMDGIRWTAALARDGFLDYEKSLFYCRKLLEYADSDYWRVPARLEMAKTYRAMGDFEKAKQQYNLIAAMGERYRSRMLLPQAEMVYFDLNDRERGRAMLQAALANESIDGRQRFNTLRKCAEHAMAQGDREAALAWYAMLEQLPFEKAEERARFLSRTWYEMGKIQESLGRIGEAKTLYRKSMELEDGEMRYRARSRDALESIEYFE